MRNAVALLMFSSLLSGCICTEAWCEDNVSLVMGDVNNVPWPSGNYRFVFVTPDRTRTINCTLPTRPADPTVKAIATCDRVEGVDVNPFPTAQWFFTLKGTPASIRFTAERDGVVLGDRTVTPTYDDQMPNGPHCSPTCRVASASILF
jgi:hypothetical protein